MFCFGNANIFVIYQPSVETSVDLSAEIILRRGSREIYETFVSLQFQRKNKRVLINVAAGNKRDLNITPLYMLVLMASPLEFTT